MTKYSNITDVSTGQKKLIMDEAIVPAHPVFDWEVTYGAPPALTAGGALDGIAHPLEVLCGAVGRPMHLSPSGPPGSASSTCGRPPMSRQMG